jgi:ascorbate-specific PTS system EIIC-type component UlaA
MTVTTVDLSTQFSMIEQSSIILPCLIFIVFIVSFVVFLKSALFEAKVANDNKSPAFKTKLKKYRIALLISALSFLSSGYYLLLLGVYTQTN